MSHYGTAGSRCPDTNYSRGDNLIRRRPFVPVIFDNVTTSNRRNRSISTALMPFLWAGIIMRSCQSSAGVMWRRGGFIAIFSINALPRAACLRLRAVFAACTRS